MTSCLSSSSLTTHLTPPGCVDPAAPLPSASGDGAAFCHYTESAPVIVGLDQASGPAVATTFLQLPDECAILLHAIASYEQCPLEQALVMALATHVAKIGCGPLARAVLDSLECASRAEGAPAGRAARGARSGLRPAADEGDLTDVPVFVRTGENRFVLTPKAPDGAPADADDARSGLRPAADSRSGGP